MAPLWCLESIIIKQDRDAIKKIQVENQETKRERISGDLRVTLVMIY